MLGQKIEVTIDKNASLGYEKRNLLYFLTLPLVQFLTFWVMLKKKILGPNLKVNVFWFDGVSSKCREVKKTASGWKALDIIYNYQPEQDQGFAGLINDFWNNLANVKALRNRLQLLKQKLREQIGTCSSEKSEIRLLSIASGSAQGVIEVMAEFKPDNIPLRAIFLDLDPSAIEYSKELAQEAGVAHQIKFINKGIDILEEETIGFRPHIVELVGFLDYRNQERATELIKRIHRLLDREGMLFVSNISDNVERSFVHQVVDWPPIFYRSPEAFAKILTEAGFESERCKIIYEPLKIHALAICRK